MVLDSLPLPDEKEYELMIDCEYEGWILIAASITSLWLYCLPCWCAGLPYRGARRFANGVFTRLPLFYFLITVVVVSFMGGILVILPDWDVISYLQQLVTFLGWFFSHLVKFALSMAILLIFLLVYMSRDRILTLLGMEHVTFCRFSWRDCLSCWSMHRFRVIEVRIVKVDELPSQDLFTPNDVYVELHMGFNEVTRTRVHNNAGAGCLLGEVIQLNFDPDDPNDKLTIIVKNQEVVLATMIGQVEFNAQTIREIISIGEPQQFRLIPKGKVWVDIRYLEEHPGNTAGFNLW
eukprot:GEMP01032214.1.p1 GENE.GEMP01032214.1~~GEMP01032214.1.p1  ORF type:complete len:292 (-),score=26.88 GEMP01032214.1:902-1777(-)